MHHIVGCNVTQNATPSDASVGSRATRDSSIQFQYPAVIKQLIRWLPVKLSHSPFTYSLLIFLGNYLPKNNYEKRQTGWVWIPRIHSCLSVLFLTKLWSLRNFVDNWCYIMAYICDQSIAQLQTCKVSIIYDRCLNEGHRYRITLDHISINHAQYTTSI